MKYNILNIFILLNFVKTHSFTFNPIQTRLSVIRNLDVSSYNEEEDVDVKIIDNIINVESYNNEEELMDATINDSVSNKKSVLFYTGKLKNALPSEIYNTFLNKLSEKNKLYIASSELEKNIALLDNIVKTENVSIISHSTSASDAIELVKYIEDETTETTEINDRISSVILIDPLDHYYFKDNMNLEQYNVFNYLNKMEDMEDRISSFIEADKLDLVFKSIFKSGNKRNKKINKKILILKTSISNRWKIFPPIPPINKYSLNLNKLKNKEIILIQGYGHFDILDSTWSNMIHNTFSRGSPSRDNSNLENYHNILIEHINKT